MIGGLLFRYWEGGARARQEQPNVRVEWLRKSRKPEETPQPAPDERGAVLVPIRVELPTAGVAPRTLRANASLRGTTAVAACARLTAAVGVATAQAVSTAVRTALPDPVLARAAAPEVTPMFRWGKDWVSLDEYNARGRAVLVAAGGGVLPAPFGGPRSVDEHNRRAIAAIAAAMLADAD